MKPIANQRNDENLIKLKLIKIPNNWKNHYTEYKCRWQDNSRITQTRRWRILTKCKGNRNKKTNSWFLKVKNQEKRIHFIVQQARHRKVNESSKTKIYPPEQEKTDKKAELQHTEHWNILQKNGQKTCKAAFMQKISTIFQKLNA